jgi:hypothetical protein
MENWIKIDQIFLSSKKRNSLYFKAIFIYQKIIFFSLKIIIKIKYWNIVYFKILIFKLPLNLVKFKKTNFSFYLFLQKNKKWLKENKYAKKNKNYISIWFKNLGFNKVFHILI